MIVIVWTPPPTSSPTLLLFLMLPVIPLDGTKECVELLFHHQPWDHKDH
jgi:hypothetical protein